MLGTTEYEKIKAAEVQGRYVTNKQVFAFLSRLHDSVKTELLGESVLGRPIKSVVVGTGPKRVLMWSQMHGNEATTTKAVLDLVNYLADKSDTADFITKRCTLKIIPILSPDGAEAYTRTNANNIDLNRDAQDLSQPESVVLRQAYGSFDPHFCFNLHDQRTLYNVGAGSMPATVSFLSPSVDEARTITPSREKAMKLVVAMNNMLQKLIPNQVGRYDDGYNLDCVGDFFQTLNCPTVLFEAGHFQDDYDREVTRKLIFLSLLTALSTIGRGDLSGFNTSDYFEIPENGKQFYDILIKNVHRYNPKYSEDDSIGILYEEILEKDGIVFIPKVEKVGALDSFFGHKTYDCGVEEDLEDLLDDDLIRSAIENI